MSYASNNYYKKGSWNVICDVCGVRYKAEEIRKRWDGLLVCHHDWEPDHPQKYLRVPPTDPRQVPYIRTEPEDTFVSVCYLTGRSSYAGLATADCAQAEYTPLPYSELT